MTLKDVADIAKAVGIPMAYDHFDEEPVPPYIVYYYPAEDDFMADGVNYANIRALTFDLITSNKNFELEKDLESELRDAGLSWYKTTDFNEDEKIYLTTYETGVLINEQQS